jgi:uncharacterized membrane protein
MIVLYMLIGFVALYVLYELQNFWRTPVYNKVYNMWQEDTEKTAKANLTILAMCIISFILGIICTTALI